MTETCVPPLDPGVLARVRRRQEVAESRIKLLLKEFDPDQPRDEGGKWTSNGGGGAATAPLPPPPPQGKGATLSSLGIKPTEEYRERAVKGTDDQLVRAAWKYGKSRAEVAERIEENMRQMLEGGQVKMGLPYKAFEEIFKPDGSFKNQHETRASMSGSYVPEIRSRAEQDGFGISEDAQPQSYPKYGYVDNPKVPNEEMRTLYGDVTVTFKDSVKERTTVTFGDSLAGLSQALVIPQPINDPPDWRSTSYATYADGDRSLREIMDDMVYVEAQIHTDRDNPLTWADVESVHFEPSPSVSVADMARYVQMATDRGVEVKTRRLDVKEFDPSQPRGEDGKWTSDGGGGGPMPPPPPTATRGPTLASLKIAPKDSYRRAAERDIDGWLEEVADTTGRTPEQVKANVEDNMQRYMDGAQVKMRVATDAFEKIFAPGARFENQLATGKTTGIFDPSRRNTAEANAFGVSGQADNHPKYGWMENPAAPSEDAKAYGAVEITFKDHVKDRATMTFGDSLAPIQRNAVLPQPANAPADFRAAADELIVLSEPNMSLERIAAQISYVEVQIHGPDLTADDVASVHFDTSGTRGSERSRLTDTGSRARLEQIARDRGVEVKRFSHWRLALKEFDPGQPRDESGKWTSGGGDGGGGAGPLPPPPPGFSPASTPSAAEAFTRSLPGVKDVRNAQGVPLLTQNTVNKGFARMAEAGYEMPATISYSRDEIEVQDRVAEYFADGDRIDINVNHPYWSDPEKEGARDERVGRTSSAAPEQPIIHELGHKAHVDGAGSGITQLPFGGVFRRNWEAEQDTAMKVSSYAGASPGEFVAETFAGKLLGKTYDEDVDKLYARYQGPAVTGPLKMRTKEFDPDQPRGEDGKWTSGDGGTGAPLPPPPPPATAGPISARQQAAAGWIGDQDDVTVEQDARAQMTQRDLFGRQLTDGELARLANAPAGGIVEVRSGTGALHLTTEAPHLNASVTIERDGDELLMYTNGFYLEQAGGANARPVPGGVGTRLAVSQLEAARELGVDRAELEAAGGPGRALNGYYTWPRLGYDTTEVYSGNFSGVAQRAVKFIDGQLEERADKPAPEVARMERAREAIMAVSTPVEPGLSVEESYDRYGMFRAVIEPNPDWEDVGVLDIMSTPEGRLAWQYGGNSVETTFDVKDPNSRNWQVLDAYLDEIGYGPR